MDGLEVKSYFFDSIELLRTNGDIILHSNFVQWSEDDEEYAIQFLASEFQNEAVNYPGQLPPFNEAAAIWGAKTVFVASQLLMLRDIAELEFTKLLPSFDQKIDLSAILSADLCLRFLPDVIEQAEDIDTYDGLIPILDELLLNWSYSRIGRRLLDPKQEVPNIEPLKIKEMQLLLVERIVERKAQHTVPHEIRLIVKPYLEINLNE